MKARLLTVLLVSMLILAMAAPLALAQATAGDGKATAGGDQATAGDDRDNGNAGITIVDCSQVQNAFGSQDQYGNASAQYQSEAIAIVSQELNISQNQVNECLGGQPNDSDTGDTTTGDTTTGDTTTGDTTTADTTAGANGEGDVIAGSIPEADELPDTGGPSGIALAAGCALLGVGLIVNRIFR